MGLSLLAEVSDSVKQYAQVISNIIGMDVDIADENLIRVAGTGSFSERVGESTQIAGDVFKRTIAGKAMLDISSPGKDPTCALCPTKDVCAEKYEICCPILLGNESIGAISIVAFEENQVRYILENKTALKEFLENIADLISAKVSESKNEKSIKTSLQLLRNMIDYINEGILILQSENAILFMNKKAKMLLGHSVEQLSYLAKIKEFSIRKKNKKTITGNVEYTFKIRGQVVTIDGNYYPIMVDNRETVHVFIFEDIAELNQNYILANHRKINFNYILGQDKTFRQIKQQAKEFACTNRSLLIRGESGTGKEVFARAICNESPRKSKPFITVSCNGKVDALSEWELFGYLPNSPTEKKLSKFELASEGTLFIDEIGSLPLRLQARLVEFMSKDLYKVRIIASSSANLEEMMQSGEFRKDLYYMLDSCTLNIPPIRKRKGDIRLLVDYFLKASNSIEGKQITLSEEVYDAFDDYSWPGNVREIEFVMGTVVNSCFTDHAITLDALPQPIREKILQKADSPLNLETLERSAILRALNGNAPTAKGKMQAAKALGISTASLYRKIKKYQIRTKGGYYFSK